jgi:hypothetical protein
MAELVDALDLGSSVLARVGSSPTRGTKDVHSKNWKTIDRKSI